MKIDEQIRKHIQKRKLDAATKHLTAKFRLVLDVLGSPIISQIGDMEFDEDVSCSFVGRVFDALSSGYNLWIKYELATDLLTVTWHGNLIYRESEGELTCYVPMKEWEDVLEKLYLKAGERSKKHKEEAEEENKSLSKQKVMSFLDEMRKSWGF